MLVGMWTKTFRQLLSDDGDGQLLLFVLMYNYKYPMVNVSHLVSVDDYLRPFSSAQQRRLP